MKTLLSKMTTLAVLLILTGCSVSVSVAEGADGYIGTDGYAVQKGNQNHYVKPNGKVTTTIRFTGADFNAIKASSGLQVILQQSNTTLVKVTADENIQEIIKTTIEDGVLRLYVDGAIKGKCTRKVYVNVVHLDNIQATSGSLVQTENTLKVDALVVKSTSGSDVNLKLSGNAVTCKSTSGSSLNLSGNTKTLNALATSGSSINTANLSAQKCEVKATSGATLLTYCNKNISAKVTSGASVVYEGKPTNVSISKSSGGSVSRK